MALRDDATRDLLLGLLALQNGFIDQASLIAAFHVWSLDRSQHLGRILEQRGALATSRRELLEELVEAHISQHGGDPQQSLAAVQAQGPVRIDVRQIADSEVQASLAGFDPEYPPTIPRITSHDSPPAIPPSQTPLTSAVGMSSSSGRRFRPLRFHDRGGLGEVFVAQDEELQREVALKEIQGRWADDAPSRARFLLEATITGGLEHPGIVPVYGLGAYPDGRPYYAMRFIRGQSLQAALRQFHEADHDKRDPGKRTLELRNLLDRFVDMCNAIGYAHSRGVVHRDLKPANVMLGPYGETLVVDWGLAKPVGRPEESHDTGEMTLRPEVSGDSAPTCGPVGTPSYMSPEQAAGRLDQLGPASDVYSLGATLYHLLTGQTPFEDKDIATILQRVQRGDFPPPRQAKGNVPAALEAVCLKAMAMAPEDRYASPRALAGDVERWLADEPVSAWHEPFSVRARRWMRRNRTVVAGLAAGLLAGLIGLATVAIVQARDNDRLSKANAATSRALAETSQAKKAAEDALAETSQAKKATEAALTQSEESRKQAEAVSTFMVEAFRSPDPGRDGRLVKVADVLDRTSDQLDKHFTGSPSTKAALLLALGQTYHGLGLYDRAVSLFTQARAVREAALGPDDPKTLESRNNLALAYYSAGRLSEAIPLMEATLKTRETKLGPDHPDTLKSRNNLANGYLATGRIAEAIRLHEQTLKLMEAKLGLDHPDTLQSRNNLAETYRGAGRIAEAIRSHEQTLKLRGAKLSPDHPDMIQSRNNLASAYYSAGRLSEAIPLMETTLKISETKLGPGHPDTLKIRNNLAVAYQAAGRIAEAIRLQEQTVKLMETNHGLDHPDTLQSRHNLALNYYYAGRLSEAIPLIEATLKMRETKLGPDHPDTLKSRNNLALAYQAAGRAREAMPLFEETFKQMQSKLGANHPDTLTTEANLASVYASLDRWADTEPLLRDALARLRKTEKPESLVLAGERAALGLSLLKQAKWQEAEPLLRECLVIQAKAIPFEWQRFNTLSMLGGALLGQGRYREAEPLVVQGYEGMKARAAKIPAWGKSLLTEAADRVVRLYEAWGKPKQAAVWKAKLGLADLPADVFARP